MRKVISLWIFFWVNVSFSFGQGNWIYLKENLRMTDSVSISDIKIKYLHDSTNLKVYRAVDINNLCDRPDYYGYFYTSDINSRTGQLVLYYENSQLKSKGKYVNGLKNGFWIEYYKNGQVDNKGSFVHGKRESIWNWCFENGQVSSEEIYEMDKLLSFEMWDSLGNSANDSSKLERFALFIKGNKHYDFNYFRKYVNDNLQYPKELLEEEKAISGKVIVEFYIDKSGMIHTKLVKGVHKLLDEEVLRVINLQNKWIPAVHHNRNTEMQFTIPVVFDVY